MWDNDALGKPGTPHAPTLAATFQQMDIITRIKINIYVALIIAVAVGLSTALFIWAFSFLGYGAFIFAYIFILTGLVTFYWLTSILTTGWTILAFFLNFVAWTAEQVVFEKKFHDTVLYQEEGITQIFVLTFGALLFSINKVLFEKLFILFGARTKDKMRIHRILTARRKGAAQSSRRPVVD